MSEPIMASALPDLVNDNPLEFLSDLLAFSSRDWGAERDSAELWAVIHGWDDEHGDGGPESAWAELTERFRWDDAKVQRLRHLHTNWRRLETVALDLFATDAD